MLTKTIEKEVWIKMPRCAKILGGGRGDYDCFLCSLYLNVFLK